MGRVQFRFLRRARPPHPPGRRQAHAPTNHAALVLLMQKMKLIPGGLAFSHPLQAV